MDDSAVFADGETDVNFNGEDQAPEVDDSDEVLGMFAAQRKDRQQQVKINARLAAVDLATRVNGVGAENIVAVAKAIEEYALGD